MKTENNENQNNKTKRERIPRIKFLEYSSVDEKNKHFLTVLGAKRGEVLGRVTKKYNPEKKSMEYFAVDDMGNAIFADELSLTGLKKKFIERAKEMAKEFIEPVSYQTGGESDQPEVPISAINYEKKKQLEEIRKDKDEKGKNIDKGIGK